MKKENKIISFNSYQKRKNNKSTNCSKYELRCTIVITIIKHGDNYTFEFEYPEELSEDAAYKILFDIYLKAARRSKKTNMHIKKILHNSFSILYYANSENPEDFTFICTPKVDDNLLSAILWVMINNS